MLKFRPTRQQKCKLMATNSQVLFYNSTYEHFRHVYLPKFNFCSWIFYFVSINTLSAVAVVLQVQYVCLSNLKLRFQSGSKEQKFENNGYFFITPRTSCDGHGMILDLAYKKVFYSDCGAIVFQLSNVANYSCFLCVTISLIEP